MESAPISLRYDDLIAGGAGAGQKSGLYRETAERNDGLRLVRSLSLTRGEVASSCTAAMPRAATATSRTAVNQRAYRKRIAVGVAISPTPCDGRVLDYLIKLGWLDRARCV